MTKRKYIISVCVILAVISAFLWTQFLWAYGFPMQNGVPSKSEAVSKKIPINPVRDKIPAVSGMFKGISNGVNIYVAFFIAAAVFCGILLDISSELAGERQNTVSDLELIVVAARRSQDTGFFNDILGPDDIVFTYGAKIRLLQRVTKPKTMIEAGAVSSLKKELAKLKGTRVDYIQYNPEQWKESHTPKEETANLADAVKSVRLLAEQYKAKLSFTPRPYFTG